eukprot:scaffold3467_cov42-Attheya_sp.AAC.1
MGCFSQCADANGGVPVGYVHPNKSRPLLCHYSDVPPRDGCGTEEQTELTRRGRSLYEFPAKIITSLLKFTMKYVMPIETWENGSSRCAIRCTLT